MFWRKDGEEIHEGVDLGEILPNNDETFQMSVDLNVTPEDWERYHCVFQFSGVNNDIIIKLDRAVIRTNMKNPTDIGAAIVVLVIVSIAVVVIVAAMAAVAAVAVVTKEER
ncbi:unnamed protein product [Oreochromis niloticus]|nr:unnamed protein product [Mustela putorius furo]